MTTTATTSTTHPGGSGDCLSTNSTASAGTNRLRGHAVCPGRGRRAPHARAHGRGCRRDPPCARPGGNLL